MQNVDVLHSIDAEAVNAEVFDSGLVNLGQAVDNLGLFRKQVIQPKEVAILRALTGKGRVPAIMVMPAIVQPIRLLDCRIFRRAEDRRVRKTGLDVERWEGTRSNVVSVIEDVTVRVLVGRLISVSVVVFRRVGQWRAGPGAAVAPPHVPNDRRTSLHLLSTRLV